MLDHSTRQMELVNSLKEIFQRYERLVNERDALVLSLRTSILELKDQREQINRWIGQLEERLSLLMSQKVCEKHAEGTRRPSATPKSCRQERAFAEPELSPGC